jgi:hypothetical protein
MYGIKVRLSAKVVGLVILSLTITSITRTVNAQGIDPLDSLLSSLRPSLDSSTIEFKNEAAALISEIQATDLYETGKVQDLIYKV